MSEPSTQPDGQPEATLTVMCARHPSVATGLRCSRCGTPICPKCMVQAPVGVRCPDCGKPTSGLPTHPSLPMYLQSGGAGLGAATGIGALLTVLPLGFFGFIAAMIGGYLVGDVVSRVSRRLPYRELAILAFICAAVGSVLGRAVVFAVMFPIADPSVRLSVAMTSAVFSLGIFGALATLLAGVAAAGRVMR